jgi:alpha-beta hydrolase superfamily lysophospholipase
MVISDGYSLFRSTWIDKIAFQAYERERFLDIVPASAGSMLPLHRLEVKRMGHKEYNFEGAAGIKLYAQSWTPEEKARALVVITHGHGEHSGRYQHVGEALAARGFCVVALDLRGHGRSGGPRGFIKSWGDFRQDLDRLIEMLKPDYGDMPMFLYGHSIGGTLALDYVLLDSNKYRGVIASAPSLGKPNIPAFLFTISKILSKIVPGFSMATQLDQTALSRDPEVVRAYREDPLVHSVGTARFGTELLKTSEYIQAHAVELKIPLLIIHGAQDRLLNPTDSQRFFSNVKLEDKTFIELPDGYHEPHNDLEKDVVIKRIGDWIEAHL